MSHSHSPIHSPRFFFSLFSSLFVIGSVHFALGRTTSWQEWVLHVILSALGMGVTWQWWQQQKELRRYHLSLQEQKHLQETITELQQQQQKWQQEKDALLADRESLGAQLQQRQTELEHLEASWQAKWQATTDQWETAMKTAVTAERSRQTEIEAEYEAQYTALRESLTTANSQAAQALSQQQHQWQAQIALLTAENQALLDEYQKEVDQQEQELQRLRLENEQMKYQLQETENHELELQQRLKKCSTAYPATAEAYRLRIQCAEDLALPAKIYEQIFSKILHLQTEPRPSAVEKVKKYRHQYPNLYRLRAGDYRVYYLVDDSQREVQVVMIDIKDGDKTTDERLGRRL